MKRSPLSLSLLASVAVLAGASAARAQCNAYNVVIFSGTAIEPGTTDTGNHGDDVTTGITLPFAVSLYGASYTAATVSSNGNLQFNTSSGEYTNSCLPEPSMGVMLAPHWDDLMTTSGGVFTSMTGSAPNRVLNIEWRAGYYPSTTPTVNFEIRLFENNSRFEFVYGAIPQAGSGATVGVQPASGIPLQFECDSGGLSQGTRLSFTPNSNSNVLCGSGSANPASVTNCGGQTNTLLVVHVVPANNPPSTGITASADLSSIGGSAAQTLYDDATHGDVTAGDNNFSFRAPVPSTVTPGGKVLQYSLADAQGRTGSGSITMSVIACPTRGPDVWVSDLIDVAYYGVVGGVNAYAVGTNACNLGDVPVGWYAGANRHPVIAQNMFRLKGGRFEQIGQSWLKHGFASTNSDSCGTCVQPPDGGAQLGVSCSDAYGSGLNGGQDGLGPRFQVNATTGVYPYPPANPPYNATIGRRLQVFTADADPAQNAGALYFVECHYVTADDAQFNNGTLAGTNGLNNSTYRRINMSAGGGNPTFAGNSIFRVPPIQAWRDNDASVQISPADYTDQTLGAPGIVGRFWVASKVTSNGNGTWHYEYAVYNHNADRCAGSFSIPIAAGTVVSNIGFHGVFAHSGEPFPNTAANADNWAGSIMNGTVVWSCPEAYAPPNGDNGNALRWGTMYNYRFDANVPPSATGGMATVGLYKPPTASNPATSASAAVQAPGTPCGSADFNHDGSAGTDADIEAFFACIAGNCCAACGSADFNGDGDVATDADIEAFFRVLAGGAC